MIIMEPDWNPATDKQAAGRIYREGQMRPVHIYRLIAAGTIEETILSRQREKVD
jgi:SNF2 family DNA or RNA helicase